MNARLKMAPRDLFGFSVLVLVGVTLLAIALQTVTTLFDPAVVVTDVTVAKLLPLLVAPPMLVGTVGVLIIETRRVTRMLVTLFESQPPQFISRTVARQPQA